MKKVVLAFALLLSGIAFAQQLPEAPQPRFLSKTNLLDMSAVGVALALDGLSTQNMTGHGLREMNPLIPHSRIGTSAYFAGAFAADVAGVYMLRHHPRIHRLINAGLVAEELYLANHNFHNINIVQREEAACLASGPPSRARCPY